MWPYLYDTTQDYFVVKYFTKSYYNNKLIDRLNNTSFFDGHAA